MNKKGTSILLIIFELVIVVLVMFTTVNAAKLFGEADTTTKVLSAEEIRMMVNTLVSLEGDAIVTFPQNMTKFSFILKSDQISIFKKGEPAQKWVNRPIHMPDGFSAEGIAENSEKICLEKNKRSITLKKCQ